MGDGAAQKMTYAEAAVALGVQIDKVRQLARSGVLEVLDEPQWPGAKRNRRFVLVPDSMVKRPPADGGHAEDVATLREAVGYLREQLAEEQKRTSELTRQLVEQNQALLRLLTERER